MEEKQQRKRQTDRQHDGPGETRFYTVPCPMFLYRTLKVIASTYMYRTAGDNKSNVSSHQIHLLYIIKIYLSLCMAAVHDNHKTVSKLYHYALYSMNLLVPTLY